MSESRFSCPNCSQHIACDESYQGLQINCPTCGTLVKVPALEVPAGGGSQAAPTPNVDHSGGGLRIAHSEPYPGSPGGPRLPNGPTRTRAPSMPDNNAWLTTWLLSFFLGVFGVDRFYNGRTGLGIGKLLATILTCGTLGLIWGMIDFILLLVGNYQDAGGTYLRRPQGRYMTLQIIGIFFAALGGGTCLLLAYWIVGISMMLTNHSSFGPGQPGIPPSGAVPNASGPAGAPFPGPPVVQVNSLQEWQRLPGPLVRVQSGTTWQTGPSLSPKLRYQIYPCPTDRWNANPPQWKDVDYRGHMEVNQRTANGRPFMQLCYQIGDSDVQAVEMGTTVSGPGSLRLFPSGQNSDGNVWNNTGFIRVKIVTLGSTPLGPR